MKTVIATVDGTYQLNSHKDARSAVYTYGNFGTATVKLVYENFDGTYTDFQQSGLVSGTQLQVVHGAGLDIFASVSGSDASTYIELKCAGID
jgi:hypothetical protein